MTTMTPRAEHLALTLTWAATAACVAAVVAVYTQPAFTSLLQAVHAPLTGILCPTSTTPATL